MAAMIRLSDELFWLATGGLFDWTLALLVDRLEDEECRAKLREILENNLGSLWLEDFDGAARQVMLRVLSEELVPAAEAALPVTAVKDDALDHLRSLSAKAARLRG